MEYTSVRLNFVLKLNKNNNENIAHFCGLLRIKVSLKKCINGLNLM